MELELPLGMRRPQSVILQFLQQFLQVAFLALHELDPKLIIETVCLCVGAMPLQLHHRVERRFWRLDTGSVWWDQLVMELWDNFGMKRETFLDMCAWLVPALT